MTSDKDTTGKESTSVVAVLDVSDADVKLEQFGYQPELPRVQE
jgi:hypothetical protein